jgi:hypothetical protein
MSLTHFFLPNFGICVTSTLVAKHFVAVTVYGRFGMANCGMNQTMTIVLVFAVAGAWL